ncbi:MAG TPA: hypothetical protein VLY03_06700 [Bacteroidota bacterium]|nr:hypothetical protein [Bacteroidota bacterium]
MKQILLVVCVMIAAMGFQSKRADYSGKWKLSLKLSKGLPSSFKHVDSYTMQVDQTDTSMVINTHLMGSGQSVDFPPTIIPFDSAEQHRVDTLRGSDRWISSTWTTTGQKLIVTNKVTQHRGTTEQRYVETDVWQFGKRGTLMILVTQKFEGGDSSHTEQRYFSRVR